MVDGRRDRETGGIDESSTSASGVITGYRLPTDWHPDDAYSAFLEEWARRALLFPKAQRLPTIEVRKSILQSCFSSNNDVSRLRHQFGICIEPGNRESGKLRCFGVFQNLVTAGDP